MSAKSRWIVVAVALAGATCLAISVGAATWWSVADFVKVRPTATESCFQPGECQTGDLSWLGGGELWRRAGIATWAAGMITALALVMLAGANAAKRQGTTIAGMTLVSSITAAVAGAVFVFRFPGMTWPQGTGEGLPSPTTAMGSGPVLYLIGAFLAAITAILVLRRTRT